MPPIAHGIVALGEVTRGMTDIRYELETELVLLATYREMDNGAVWVKYVDKVCG